MIRAYSERILPPYLGTVQVVESGRAWAQSFDGISWEMHYASGNEQTSEHGIRVQGPGADRGFRVAGYEKGELRPYILPACVDADEVTASITELSDFLATAKVPFPAADTFEYWLLDDEDDSPLALILSCCDETQMAAYPPRTDWTAIPHSKMQVDNTAEEQARNEPPVNHRLQELISKRAGASPRAAWFNRQQNRAENFPCFLVREDWQNETDHDLCQRYIARKSPRLLMLQGLSHPDRERLELAARRHALEVDDYYPLYPEVNDQDRMSAIRVEAQLRRRTPDNFKLRQKEKAPKDTAMSKDMRIFET